MLEVLSVCEKKRTNIPSIKITGLTFQVKQSEMKLSWGCILFKNTQKNFKLNPLLESKGLLCTFYNTVYMLSIADSNIYIAYWMHNLPCYLNISLTAQCREYHSVQCVRGHTVLFKV